MANLSTADLVRQNFVWKIKGQTPTSGVGRQRFTHIDPLRLSAEDTAGLGERSFSVFWLSSSEDHIIEGDTVSDNLTERPAVHFYNVEIYYSTKFAYDKLQDMMLQDRHDLTRNLRNSTSMVGISDSQSSLDIGLWHRVREDDELDTDDENVWIYRATWRCTINEGEN